MNNATARTIFGILLLTVTVGQTLQADTFTVRFTPTDAGGRYGTSYVQAVWLTDTSNNRVCTLGTGNGKVALWANTRYGSCYTWYSNNPTYRTDDRTDRTGATQSGYREYVISWDCTMYNTSLPDGTTLPDGNYKLWMECSNGNDSNNLNVATFNITKGRTPWVQTPANGKFLNVRIEYVPSGLGISNLPAGTVTETSAVLNGQVTGTDGENPLVYLYWGNDNQGGTSPAGWDHAVSLGIQGIGTLSHTLTGLTPVTTYYYRFRVVSSTKDIWANDIQTFTTLSPAFSDIAVSPQMIQFKDVPENQTRQATVALQNLGDKNLTITSLNLTGLDKDHYSLIGAPTLPLTIPTRTNPWSNRDIGEVGAAGSTTYGNGTITISGSGEDIWGEEDEFHYAYQSLNGDGEIIAKVNSVANTNTWAKAGVMIRNGTSNEAKHAFMCVTPGNGVSFQRRVSTEGASTSTTIGSLTAPTWVRLVRQGSTFSAYYSSNGSSWTPVGSESISMSTSVLIGLAVTSHSDGTLCQAAFSSIRGTLSDGTENTLRNLTVQLNTTRAGDYPYARLAVGSDDPDTPVTYVDLQAQTIGEAAYTLRAVGGIGSASNCLAQYGSDVLVGQGHMLCRLQMGDPAGPVLLRQMPLDDTILDIAIQGDRAAVALGKRGVALIDLTNFTPIEPLAGYNTDFYAQSVAWHGDHLCVADGSGGLIQYAISVSSLQPDRQYTPTEPVTKVTITGDRAWLLCQETGVKMVELSTWTPKLTGQVGLTELPRAMAVNGDTVYVTNYLDDFMTGQYNGSTLTVTGQCRLQGGTGRAMALSGDFACVATAAGIELVNITNPDEPVSVRIIPGTDGAVDLLAVDTNRLAVARQKLGVCLVDLANPELPAVSNPWTFHASPAGLTPVNGLERVLTAEGDEGLQVVDLSEVLRPGQISMLNTLGQASEFAVVDDKVHIANGLDGLRVASIADPAHPVLKGHFDSGTQIDQVAANAATLLAADERTLYRLTNDNDNPDLISSWHSPARILDLALYNGYVYLASAGMGIQTVLIESLSPVSQVDTADTAYSLAIAGNTLYAAQATGGLAIFSLNNPAAPALIGQYDLPGRAVSLAVINQRLCLANSQGGVTIFDITDPANPIIHARTALPAESTRINQADSRLLVSNRNGGLSILAVVPQPARLTGDLNDSGQIDAGDLPSITDEWLVQENNLNPSVGNIFFYDTRIDLYDFSELALRWLSESSNPKPIAYWKFDENGNDSVGNRDALLENGAAISHLLGNYKIGNGGLVLDGINDLANCGAGSGLTYPAFTVAFWFNANAISLTQSFHIAGQRNLSSHLWSVQTWGTQSGHITGFVNGSGTYALTETTITPQAGQWYHLVMTYDDLGDRKVHVYVNGQEPSSAQQTALDGAMQMNVDLPVTLGDRIGGGRAIGGKIDDVRIYDRVLTQQEIALLADMS